MSAKDDKDSINTDKWKGIVFFNPPKLLPRIPYRGVLAGDELTVDFRNERERGTFVEACRVHVLGNCGAGARRSCALRATEQCKSTLWGSVLALLHLRKAPTAPEMDECEAKELHACVLASSAHCREFAFDFCTRVSRPPEQKRRGKKEKTKK